ncbi:MAG: two-component sensor histidine kinase, partial [Deltaproteobacteria bacterium]|nr:two-component sensor histidine kinase [Deltaproteobacteria bacterium]
QYRRLDRVVRQTIHSLNIDQVNIYDLDGILVYTTTDKEIGQPGQGGPDFEAARRGQEISGLVSEPSVVDFILHHRLTEPVKLMTLTAFRAENISTNFGPRPVLGIFELVIDLTSELEQVFQLQVLVALVACGLMAILSFILTLIVRQGERILNRRAEERKRLEDKLRESERMAALGSMVASVSHEIKSPLGIIRSTSELLAGQMDEDNPSQRLPQVIVEECNRLNRIVTEFLDFARPQEPNLRPCRIDEIMARNLAALGPELEKQGVKLEQNLAPGPETLADPDLLYRAFLNILVNAIQAMPQGGKLRVDVKPRPTGGGWQVEVADSGQGISEEALEKVFDPFFTLKEKGSGLGLSIVKSIIDAHQGMIEIDSTPGQGTRVIVVV